MNILVISLHSAYNQGDRLLLNRALELLYNTFPEANIVLVANDPDSFATYKEQVIPSLTWWFKRPYGGHSRWVWSSLATAPFLLGMAVLMLWGGLPVSRLLLTPQRRLLTALTNADLVVAAPGNYFYSSGRLGLAFFLPF